MRKLNIFLIIVIVFFNIDTMAQSVGISDQEIVPHASAALEIRTNTKGLLIPRLTKAERDVIATPANGLLIYQTDASPGFYYFNGTSWSSIGASGTDSDNDPTNELQKIRVSGDTIYLDKGGDYVKIPPVADNSISEAKIQDSQITARKLASMGASTDQFLRYDGNKWVPASVAGGLTYKGTWNAGTNSPTINDATGQNSQYYIITAAGTQNLGSGSNTYSVGDWVVHNGSIWQKMNNSNDVNSVFGRKGAVIAQPNDYKWSQIKKDTSSIGDIADVDVSIPTAGNILVANGTVWNSKTVNGDLTMDQNGSLNIKPRAIQYSDLQNGGGTPNTILSWNGAQWAETLLSSIDGDVSATNEIQDLSLSGNTLSLSSDASSVNLTPYAQTLSFTAPNLTITNGNSVDLSSLVGVSSDNQTLTLTGSSLSIQNGNTVSLAPFLDNTDAQNLSFTSPNLTIAGGNSVNLSPLISGLSDSQNLSLSGTTLSLSNDPTTVDLSPFLDNTDSQTLSFTNPTLSLTGGGSADLSSLKDNLGNHTATQNIRTNGFWLSNDGTDKGAFVSSDGFVGIGLTEPKTPLHIRSGDDVQFFIESNSASPSTMIYMAMNNVLIPTQSFITFLNSGGSSIGNIEGNGLFGINYNTTSDRRLKDNIVSTHFGLSDLLKIQVCDYNMKNTSTLQTGFIAQDLYTIYPIAVSVGGDDVSKKPWSVDYGKLTPLLTKSIQELNTRVVSLEKDNQNLRLENEQLKEKLGAIENHEKRLNELEAQMQLLIKSTGEGQESLK